jgi:DNA-binding transcriptional regulator YiaG
MSPTQFIRRRKALFKSKVQAARYLHVDVRTVAYWESGGRSIPWTVRLIFEFLERDNHQNDRRTGQ